MTGQWLEITDLTGLHSGANPISGEFSFGASGFLHDGSNRVQPVRGITVAGNFYTMLQHHQQHFRYANVELAAIELFAHDSIR